MRTHRLVAIAATALVIGGGTYGIASAQTAGDAAPGAGAAAPAPDPCQGQAQRFVAMAKRVWSPSRWDWWDATPRTGREDRQLGELRSCAVRDYSASGVKRAWRKQKAQFEHYWESVK